MDFSLQSFYNVIKKDFTQHPGFDFANSQLDSNLEAIVNSLNVDKYHFTKIPASRNKTIFIPNTSFGDFADHIIFILTDFTKKKEEELLILGCFVAIELIKEKIQRI
jgi:hypothetical protein